MSDSGARGYRFYPDKIKGEGFFLACFEKTTSENPIKHKEVKVNRIGKKESDVIGNWLNNGNYEMVKENNNCYLFEGNVMQQYVELSSFLNIIYKGIFAGEMVRDKLIPSTHLP